MPERNFRGEARELAEDADGGVADDEGVSIDNEMRVEVGVGNHGRGRERGCGCWRGCGRGRWRGWRRRFGADGRGETQRCGEQERERDD